MDVVELPLARLIPYARNPRRNASAVGFVVFAVLRFTYPQWPALPWRPSARRARPPCRGYERC